MKPAAESHREVWRLAGPMILSNITIPLLGLVDTAVMGHLPDPVYIGAVALGAMIFAFVFWGFGFLRMGTTGIVAQVFGSGDSDGLRASLGQALLLAIGLGLALLVLKTPLSSLAFWLVRGSSEVEGLARVYFDIRIWGAPGTLINYVIIGWFLGMQNARVPLLMMVTANVTNIVLDLTFVVGLGMTADGVALASVIAEYTGTVLGVLLVVRSLRAHPGRWVKERVLDRASFARMVGVNQNIFIRTLCLVFAFAFFTSQGAAQGDLILAANAVLMNLQHFTPYALDGFAHACEALVGRYVGARDKQGLLRSVRVAAQWSAGVAALFSVIYLLAGGAIINLITDIGDVRATARLYLPWMIISPMISVWSFLLDGIFVGATRGREMRNTMLAATVLFYLPAWYWLQPWGNHGLWAALMVFMAARALTMGWSWRRLLRADAFGVGTGPAASP